MAINEEKLRVAVERYLKNVMSTAQGELKKHIRQAAASDQLKEYETITVTLALTSNKIGLEITIYEKIEFL
jgi:hypothetical protein